MEEAVVMEQNSVLGMSSEQQLTATAMWAAIINIDLQLYKGSIYALRWGSPGGLDHALPAYAQAKLAIEYVDWPEELRDYANELDELIAGYVATLERQDVTSASGSYSRMTRVFEELRERIRQWPNPLSESPVKQQTEEAERGLPGRTM